MEAGGVVEGPILKLTMEKGPLAGQVLEFKPGFIVRVGRIVRCNNLTIKDSGVSSKHLSIEFNSDDGKWLIRDLGSSNGTFLNAAKLDPCSPAGLSDSDIIKIGELTSIKVQIEDSNRAPTKPRRNPKRKTATDTAQKNDGDAAENRELGLVGEELGNNNKGKIRGPPRTRTQALKEIDLKCEREEQNAGVRMTRSSSNAENVDDVASSQVGTSAVEKAEIESAAESAVENGDQRRTRNTRGRGCRELRNLVPIDQPPVKTKRVTRSKKQSNLEEEEERAAKISIPKEHTQCIVEAVNTAEERLNFREEACNGVSAKNDEHEVREQLNSGEEACHDLPSVSGGNKAYPDAGEAVNLEIMTLGEWLDYLEINVPKQIIDSTEEMISEMRKKAVRFQEFMLHQKNAKENQD